MNEIELILLLLVAVAALTPVAAKLHIPYPILLVIGGLLIAISPITPGIELTPELVFILFLPPLVYRAAFATSIRDFRTLLKPILSLSIGLVLVTMTVVAVVFHALLPEIGWPLAFAFGAIVSPPDAVAAAAVFRGLGVPRKLATLLEGESLINDATALVALGAALGATTVAIEMGEISLRFAYVGIGGVVVGLAAAGLIDLLQQRLKDPSVEITLSLLTPFAAYLPAESLGTSGVLAAVTAGLYIGWRASYIYDPETRIRGRAVWDMIEFLLNGLVFILIGLQLSSILPNLAGRSMFDLIMWGLLLSASAIAVRLAWVYLDSYLRHLFLHLWPSRRTRHLETNEGEPNQRELFVAGWAGMRGVVSLAAVLALPQNTPERDLLIFLTFFVILATLVGQGLTLPLIIRALGVGTDGTAAAQQELHARRIATDAASARLVELRNEWPSHLPLIDTLQAQYDHRASHLGQDGDEDVEHFDQELVEHHLIRKAVIDAERAAVLDLRVKGELDDEIWRQIERDFDLEDIRMDA